MEVKGAVALVTGGARRVGRAITLALCERGANVAVHYRTSAEDAEETVASVEYLEGKAQPFQANLEKWEETAQLVTKIKDQFGGVNIIVNNASTYERGMFDQADVEQWHKHMNVNVLAPFVLAKAMWENLPDSAHGKIVNIGDWRQYRARRFCYGVSKAALSGLTRSLAIALAPRVQVNELALGNILPSVDAAPGGGIPNNLGPSGRMGTLNELTQAMLSLIENDFITGETIRLDGGDHVKAQADD